MKRKNQGHIYILESDNCESLKIGGTDFPPAKRVREINETKPYKNLGPWRLVDFREVVDWRKVEHNLHYQFRNFLNYEISNQKELFNIHKNIAIEALNKIDPNEVLYRPKIDRLFQDERFLKYLSKLFIETGLIYCIDIQGIWTLTIFTQTANGRYFTLNIDSHEVAFSTLSKKNTPQINCLVVDKMIFDIEYDEIRKWIYSHDGIIKRADYATALDRAVSIYFKADFETAMELFAMKGFRRAIIAYWYDSLISKRNDKKFSIYEHFHNYNAVSKIMNYIKNGFYK